MESNNQEVTETLISTYKTNDIYELVNTVDGTIVYKCTINDEIITAPSISKMHSLITFYLNNKEY